ncbi:MAG TPA: hypothetical protein VGG32_06885 [Thermoplasmata archaeon]|jgi:hypothetical protein
MPTPEQLAELKAIQRSAYIPLFGERTAVHWTKVIRSSSYYEPEGLAAILGSGYLEEGTSFTTSLDLSYPKDNHAPVGLVFRLDDLIELGYHHLPLNEAGHTLLELVYEIADGERVPLDPFLLGVISYNPRTLANAVRTVRNSGVIPGIPKRTIHSKVVRRPRYDIFDIPRQWADTAAGKMYHVIDLPEADLRRE